MIVNGQYSFSQSQNKIISGIILDSLKNPIQYASIGLFNKPVGTVSNSKGEFTLDLSTSLYTDTLRISSLGFEDKTIKIKELLGNKSSDLRISLYSNSVELDEVFLTANKGKVKTKGKYNANRAKHIVPYIDSKGNIKLGSEMAKRFSLGHKKHCKLNEFNFFIRQNNFDSLKFRVNIYSIKNNLPFNKINKSNILIDIIDKSTGWVKVDLTDYNINTKEDIIISVELVESSSRRGVLSLPLISPSLGSSNYYKLGAQYEWHKYQMASAMMNLTYTQ
ncbi:MAG: carboxypeptidase-like regulatory domain-containing protein [Flavobacteriaceae bacterium]|nr:carboxypeptidase-like regulatory domain-containing protein [Flavobacteriaceae bacterium]